MKTGPRTTDHGLGTNYEEKSSRSLVLFLLLVPGLWSLVPGPVVFAQDSNLIYHVTYIEHKGPITRELDARIQGGQIAIDELQGEFPRDLKETPPWFLTGLKPFEEVVEIQLEGLPPLSLKRAFQIEKDGIAKVSYSLEAKEEIIPLNEEESRQNELLKPFQIHKVDLKGEGKIWFRPQDNAVIAEEFSLRGEVFIQDRREPWQMEYARGIQEGLR